MPRKTSKKRTSWHRKEPVPLAEQVGAQITRIRKERGFTFDALVGSVEPLGRGYLSQVTRGMLVPGIVALNRIAQALEVELVDLVNLGSGARQRVIEATGSLSRRRLAELLAHADRLLEEQRGTKQRDGELIAAEPTAEWEGWPSSKPRSRRGR